MALTKTIKLKAPINWHDGVVDSVTLREPTGGDFLNLGEPFQVVKTPDGSITMVEVDATIRAYVERCLEAPRNALFLNVVSLSDAMALKAAMLDFFAGARADTK